VIQGVVAFRYGHKDENIFSELRINLRADDYVLTVLTPQTTDVKTKNKCYTGHVLYTEFTHQVGASLGGCKKSDQKFNFPFLAKRRFCFTLHGLSCI
jgi:hypothetical protein